LGEIGVQITSLVDKFNRGDYNLANFSDLKSTMADGRMTDTDVGLALGMSTSEGFVQNMKSWLTGGKGGIETLNNKEAARVAINRTIDEYNRTLQAFKNPRFGGKYADAARQAWEEKSFETLTSTLRPPFAPIPSDSPGRKDGDTWEDGEYIYRIVNGKTQRKRK
jgi:hypothetical protein